MHARFRPIAALIAAAALLVASQSRAADAPPGGPTLKLEKGDHISIIGNGLPDRMQHHGWLETALIALHPEHDLVIRNLGFTGDEADPDIKSNKVQAKNGAGKRLRSDGFGSPAQWLSGLKTNVVFAFYGYNESFAGPAGVEAFKKDVDGMLKALLAEKFDGKSAPRVVLFSPIAQENLKDPNVIDGTANNKNIAIYAKAMGEVARANSVVFVDLFTPTSEYKGDKPLTVNGIHPTEEGSKVI
ncbi:MAG: SGNH/GDSL hydrolase family protein, partial [Phycisphaerae bacterium]